MVDINLKRFEQRYILPKGEINNFLREIRKSLYLKKFSNNPYTQTIYLNNDGMSVPWGISLRARRYVKAPQKIIHIDKDELFNCEIKISTIEHGQKTKIKSILTFNDFIKWSKVKLYKFIGNQLLRPHIISQYKRRHYIAKDCDDLRITVDTELNYGYFLSNEKVKWIGSEIGSRVEIKAGTKAVKSQLFKNITKWLKNDKSTDVISKKNQAYNFLHLYLKKKYFKYREEIKNLEMEAKFDILSDNPLKIFHKIYNALRQNKIKNFYNKNFPYITTQTSIISYLHPQDNPNYTIKILYRGNKFRVDIKRYSTDKIKRKVLVRLEEKGKWLLYSNQNYCQNIRALRKRFGELMTVGNIERERIGFWAENMQSDRIYRINFDKCKINYRTFYQAEIEYDGRDLLKPVDIDCERKIKNEIIYLQREILKIINEKKVILKPSQLTKFDMLKAATQNK